LDKGFLNPISREHTSPKVPSLVESVFDPKPRISPDERDKKTGELSQKLAADSLD
jgi:hypothetical protein